MQTALRRTYATHAGKHNRRKPSKPPKPEAKKQLLRERHIYKFERALLRRSELDAAVAARRNRREDWELGPLRPWREVSPAYGTFPSSRGSYPAVPGRDRTRDWLFRVGDRVCVVRGGPHLMGRIGEITDVDRESETVVIDGVNLIDIRVSKRVREIQGDGEAFQTRNEPVPVADVRLVYPLQDPETGEYRDCILTHLEKRNLRRDPFRSFNREEQVIFDRYLMPHNLRIPWPKEEELEGRNEEDDTLRAEVEEKSFLPTLLRPPMPEGGMDELRERDKRLDGNLKAWFDAEHLGRQQAQAEHEDKRDEARLDAAPRGAKNVARKGSSAGGKFMSSKELPEFDRETLQIIGSHMAKKQQESEAAEGSQ